MLARAERKAAKHAAHQAKLAAKREATAAANLAYWTKHVLPPDVWDKVRYSDKLAGVWVRDGVPPRLRGVVWPRAVGNALHVTSEVFRVCCARATEALTSRRLREEEAAEAEGAAGVDVSGEQQEGVATSNGGGAPDMVLVGREDTLSIIHTDISRTFPHLGLFQSPHGPLAGSLATVLEAFAVYRADMGYVQGMSYLAGVLLVNMDELAAFTTLCNMFRHRQGVLNVMYRLDMVRVKAYFAVFEYLLGLACPELKVHLEEVGVRPEFYLYEWLLSMFSKPLPLDTAHRVWDLFFLWGDLALFRVAVALLKFFEPRLLGLPFEECIQDVLRLPGRIRQEYDEDKFWEVVEFLHLERDVYRAACRKEGIEPPE
ncbi:rab-GTPase-TBC domain-domain-containing protein [Catenaria anguillulae PL171]|uniref:Rab-GTPase-TBC domain-domain-containing protein n=1 Tax=Catenaria anguillulae PL171 TaxID=765915 RepID=A0A1Y2H8Y0_9FUNG|nr:rab-GTPase-TBC domain-domain-containing protein [Catenaria anguillulae PL171]